MVSFTVKYDDFPQFCGENKNLPAQPPKQNHFSKTEVYLCVQRTWCTSLFTAKESSPLIDKSEVPVTPHIDRLEVRQFTGYYAQFCVIYPGKRGDLQPRGRLQRFVNQPADKNDYIN